MADRPSIALASRNLPEGPAVLCVAHPGHELRVYGWLALARPLVVVLTDGSGRSGRDRLEVTRAALGETGAKAGEPFGAFSDRAAYALILSGKADLLIGLVEQLADSIVGSGARYVVGDAAEGYNPMHDLCRVAINAAVLTARRRGSRVLNFDFPLVARPDACPGALLPRAVEIRLDEAWLERKLNAARRSDDLAVDVDQALREAGVDAFRIELLRPVEAQPGDGLPDEPPFYERWGEERVASGKYSHVVRRRDHVLPLADAVWRHAAATAR